ncbi:hypothetical protein M1614_02360 [Candidatus Marsarchaeota archaeon]|jgi:hypothetical protein|nr:hypothetical protein [Candidatus Marsarchaeota archaeon]MCL5090285.1 hypothetical protein [Candidatus Marsarchaeota archaeon]
MDNKKILKKLKDNNTKIKSICEDGELVEICYIHNEDKHTYIMTANEFGELLREG